MRFAVHVDYQDKDVSKKIKECKVADLHWTMPIARWTVMSTSEMPSLDFIDPMVRRRLSRLSRLALQAAHDCAAGYGALRMVFASRHGELTRTTAILDAITAREPVSPTAFGLSVLNAASGVFGMVRGDRSPATAIAAGTETLGYALLEAHAQCLADAATPILMVYANEAADPAYVANDDASPDEALAVLLDARAARGYLRCEVGGGGALSAGETRGSQGAALGHCLSTHAAAAWQGADAYWQWSWHEHAA